MAADMNVRKNARDQPSGLRLALTLTLRGPGLAGATATAELASPIDVTREVAMVSMYCVPAACLSVFEGEVRVSGWDAAVSRLCDICESGVHSWADNLQKNAW